MPSIHGSLDGNQPLVSVLIAPLSSGGAFGAGEFVALIDTGSTKTCVTRTVVESLGLQPFSRVLVATPSGLERRKAYSFTVGFLDEGDGTVGAVRSPFYFPDAITGADFVKNSNFNVLLGMDILSQGRLVFDRGRFSFSF